MDQFMGIEKGGLSRVFIAELSIKVSILCLFLGFNKTRKGKNYSISILYVSVPWTSFNLSYLQLELSGMWNSPVRYISTTEEKFSAVNRDDFNIMEYDLIRERDKTRKANTKFKIITGLGFCQKRIPPGCRAETPHRVSGSGRHCGWRRACPASCRGRGTGWLATLGISFLQRPGWWRFSVGNNLTMITFHLPGKVPRWRWLPLKTNNLNTLNNLGALNVHGVPGVRNTSARQHFIQNNPGTESQPLTWVLFPNKIILLSSTRFFA